MHKSLKHALIAGTALATLATAAAAEQFNIPAGDLKTALDVYARQTGTQLLVSTDAVKGVRTGGVHGDMGPDAALSHLLSGTGFKSINTAPGAIGLVPSGVSSEIVDDAPMQLAQAAPVNRASVETVTVTSSKLGGADVQSIPIAITAMSQEQLTATQTAGGPDLVKQVPNLTFSKTNFTGYNIQIRGIGTQAISVTTDPAVAVSFNDIPFLRNHFFEQEFFDVGQVEVLRGPQGTLYGRNATSGVVNLVSAKPTDHWEAQASVDVGNYNNRRLEGMLNIPIATDMLDLRVAGEWTKRDGYSFNEETDHSTDGRNLWSSRVSLLFHPLTQLTATAIWEHFQEDDDRLRSGKQLCARDTAPDVVDGPAGPQIPNYDSFLVPGGNLGKEWLSRGCHAASLYSPESFGTPDASSFPFVAALEAVAYPTYMAPGTNPYAGVTQSHDLRTIASLIDPKYRAKNDTFEFNVDYSVTPELTLSSQTGYNHDSLYSTQDLNRYNTQGGIFLDPGGNTAVGQDGLFCDPQLGCSDRLVAQDISDETAKQFYQEVRLASSFKGNFNFLAGASYLSYHTLENYQILSNAITLTAEWANNVLPPDAAHIPFDAAVANACDPQPAITDPYQLGQTTFLGLGCSYIDPNPLGSVDRQGHNYFLSQNPYRISSWAAFGEAYYNISDDLKFTGGLRFTDDKKHFTVKPSWTLIAYKGYPITGIIDQEWREVTGRANITWTPKLDFTDQSMFYGSYARGYKGGGANPPGVIPIMAPNGADFITSPSNQTHPAVFKPEFNDAFELGTKNTLADGDIVLNGDVFLYKYQNYQISQIIDRTAVNMNVNATVKGVEMETSWSPIPGLKLGFNGGYEDAKVDDGQSAIDVMDRTAGRTDWMVVKPFITETSNCILPTAVVNEVLAHSSLSIAYACALAYSLHLDPVTYAPYVANPPTDVSGDPIPGYAGFDYAAAPNHGEGFDKNLGGNQLPNAPHYTVSMTADFTMPLSSDWAGTLHGDFYWQSNSFARIFNDRPYDEIHGYNTINMALIFSNTDGWQAMAYVKNILDVTHITGAFLSSDDTGLATNIFVTDPRLFGIRITKNW
jgi:outer membrane receptor protein involved in Fe transport